MISIAQSVQDISAKGQAALTLAAKGFCVFPLHNPIFDEDGTVRCSCGKADCVKNIGKHPREGGGYHLANTDMPTIEAWWKEYKSANIGIALEPSGLLIIGPDSDRWHEDFKSRGLPDTYTVKSGNGWHYYYRLPAGWPKKRRCISQQYDIISDGYCVAAGSVHPNGKTYTVLLDRAIADAPEWVLEELEKAADTAGEIAPRDTAEPPVRLSAGDMEWWTGQRTAQTDSGILDRSTTLYIIGNMLGRYGMSRTAIADALENRDNALFDTPKYSGRGDAETRYLTLADKAIANAVAEQESTATRRYPCTDLGNAERFVSQHGNRIRYVYERKKWAVYDGTRWLFAERGEENQLAKQTVRSIYAEAANAEDVNERQNLAEHAARSESAFRIRAMVDLAQHEKGITVSIKDFDTDHMLFNTRNATIDLRTGTARPHHRDDMLMKQAPVVYRAGIVSEKWERFLNRILPDADMRRFMQRIAGYMLTGLTNEEVFFILYGNGENGKGTFVETLQALFAEYGQTAAMSTFAIKRNDGGERASPDLARMIGARMVAVSETNEAVRFNEGLIKSLTGGDTITARFLYAEPFDFLPTHKLIFAVNHRPDITDTTRGMWRRVRLVPFEETITAEERDSDLKRALREEELQGVLNWCLAGCLAWQDEGLNQPQAVTDATQEYRADSDPLGRWIDDMCEEDSTARTSNAILYNSYKAYCETNSERWEHKNVWAGRMKTRGYKSYATKTERGYSGIKLSARGEAIFAVQQDLHIETFTPASE